MPRATRRTRSQRSRTNRYNNDLVTSSPSPRHVSAVRKANFTHQRRNREKKPLFTSFLKSDATAQKSSDAELGSAESYISFEPLGISDSPPQLDPLPWEEENDDAGWMLKLGDLWGQWEDTVGEEGTTIPKREKDKMGSGFLDGFTFDFDIGTATPVTVVQSVEESPARHIAEH
jgi:hypothetical protein